MAAPMERSLTDPAATLDRQRPKVCAECGKLVVYAYLPKKIKYDHRASQFWCSRHCWNAYWRRHYRVMRKIVREARKTKRERSPRTAAGVNTPFHQTHKCRPSEMTIPQVGCCGLW